MSKARLKKEVEQCKALCLGHKPDPSFAYIRPIDEKLSKFEAQIRAPDDSVYQGYEFRIILDVSADYPISPLTGRFETKIFHPNVKWETGEICIDILKKEWSPAWDIISSCRAIIAILADPAADSPLNCDAGNMIRERDTRSFRSMARMYCKTFAIPSTLPALAPAAAPEIASNSHSNSNNSSSDSSSGSSNSNISRGSNNSRSSNEPSDLHVTATATATASVDRSAGSSGNISNKHTSNETES